YSITWQGSARFTRPTTTAREASKALRAGVSLPRAVPTGDTRPEIFCYARNLSAVAVSNLLVRTRPGGAAQGMSDLAQTLPWGRDEAVLVTELQAGSDAAFEWLVTYYHAGVYNLVYG